jgi:putative membrane protein insertion efficiency factor
VSVIRRATRTAGWPLRTFLIGAIRVYRLTLASVMGGQCRFHPTCSAYAEEAIRDLGLLRGIPLSVWRILRCSPLSKGGVDYPPGHAERVGEAVTHGRGGEVAA